MRLITSLRIANGILWLWIWLSAALMPLSADINDFWAAKSAQLLSLNPNIRDVPKLIANAFVPVALLFIVDNMLKNGTKKHRNRLHSE